MSLNYFVSVQAQEKPVSYSVSGSVRSGTVRKRQEEMDEFNRDRVNADLVLEQMSSPGEHVKLNQMIVIVVL